MDANPAPEHRGAFLARQGLGVLLALLALATGWALLQQLRVQVPALTSWPRHAAEITSLADESWLEVETDVAALEAMPQLRRPPHATATREGHVRLLLPRPSFLWAGLRDEVDLAHDPAQPSRVLLLDFGSLWAPVAAKLVLLALLALAWRGWRRLRWGHDDVWQPGGWVDSARSAHRPGEQALPADELREPGEHLRATRIWAVVLALLTVLAVAGGIAAWDDEPVGVAATWLVLGALDLLLLHTLATVHTRVLRFDGAGVADRDFFRTRRVPWAAIASLAQVNVNEAAQRDWDRQSHASRRGRRRPKSDLRWIAADAQGTELLRLPDGMARAPAFTRLQQRLTTGSPTAAAEAAAGVFRRDDAAAQALWRAEHRRHAADFDARQREHLRGMGWGVALVLLPFALAFLFATWRAAWFVTLAERAEGTVVEKTEDGLPSLVVAYLPRGAAEPLRIQSDSTESYGEVPLGTRITVFHDAARPEHARLDLFLELWLWPIVFGVLLALVALPFGLVLRAMGRPRAPPAG